MDGGEGRRRRREMGGQELLYGDVLLGEGGWPVRHGRERGRDLVE